MISKQLLQEVLGVNISSVGNINEGYLNYSPVENDYSLYHQINIYELVHKYCIDWALNKGYDICSKEVDGKYCLLTDEKILGIKVGDVFVISDTFTPFVSRIEAVIKACEWILKKLKETHES